MTFMSVVSERAASEVVVEQVGVVRVMLFEGSERGAELIAMMLTSPEDGVAVTSPVASSQFADRSGIGVVDEVLVINGPLVDEVLVVVAVAVAEKGRERVVWTDVTEPRLLSVDAALTGVVRGERVVGRDVTAPGLSSIVDLLAASVAEFILGGAFDMAVVEVSQSEIAQVVPAGCALATVIEGLVQAVTPAAERGMERVVGTDVTATGLLSVDDNTILESPSLTEIMRRERVVGGEMTTPELSSVVDVLDFRLSQITDVVVGKTLSPPM